jgi:hypothetical protein
MPAEVSTLSLTPAQSVSGIDLPAGATLHKNGIDLPEGMGFDQWKLIGTRLVTIAHATLFALGDWLAYGEFNYKDTVWGKQLPPGIYEELEQHVDYAAQTLANAKYVCSRVERSRRRERLTFSQLLEIVSKVKTDAEIDLWQDRALKENLNRSQLREALRKAHAKFGPDPVPARESPLLRFEDMEAFFVRESDGWSESFLEECARAMPRLLERLAPYAAKPVKGEVVDIPAEPKPRPRAGAKGK